jgi:hypothetical protein
MILLKPGRDSIRSAKWKDGSGFLFTLFVGNGMDDWAQFFCKQIAAFMNDHELKANDITKPRP